MKLKRFVKSLINTILFIVNAFLWIFNINSLGELTIGVQVGKGKKQKFMYGICSLLQYFSYACIIGLVLTIYWWYKNETSIAEKLSGLHIEKLSPTTNSSTNSSNENWSNTNNTTNANNDINTNNNNSSENST